MHAMNIESQGRCLCCTENLGCQTGFSLNPRACTWSLRHLKSRMTYKGRFCLCTVQDAASLLCDVCLLRGFLQWPVQGAWLLWGLEEMDRGRQEELADVRKGFHWSHALGETLSWCFSPKVILSACDMLVPAGFLHCQSV